MYGSRNTPQSPEPHGEGSRSEERESEALAMQVEERCFGFLRPLLRELDQQLDLRLVRTLANTVTALIRHRNQSLALLLSELGAYLTSPQHAPAGTKRLSNLLHSKRWRAQVIADYLLKQGHSQVEAEAQRVGEGRALCILDGSVLEQPESSQVEGLSPVISSKARRLSRPRPKLGKGYYRGKPGGPIVVLGFNWVGVLVTGWASPQERRPVTLGAWHWYAKPLAVEEGQSEQALSLSNSESEAIPRQKVQEAAREVLSKVTEAWGAERLLHVWDRGMSGATWLGEVIDKHWQFVVRWKKGNRLRPLGAPSIGDLEATTYRRDKDGVKAWKLTAGLRAWGQEQVANPRNPKQPITVSYAARPVCLLTRDDPLWLVVVRLGKSSQRRRGSGEPWRLLTNVKVESKEQCWRVVQAYAQRWQIEQTLRFAKSELGIESVRVRAWQTRHKLLMLAALTYAFLIDLLGDCQETLLGPLLRFCHRTGKQAKIAWRPLYRLRAALAYLWDQHTPTFQGFP
jgi:hypothetical protein